MSVKNTIPETSCTVIPMGYCMPLYLINCLEKLYTSVGNDGKNYQAALE